MAEKLIINYEDYKLAVEKLALTIEKNYKPSVLVGIMRGAAPINQEYLNCPLLMLLFKVILEKL